MCSTRLPSLVALPPTHPCTLAPTQAILREQAAQRELKLTMAKAEKDDNDAYDAYAESARKMGQYTDAEVQAARAEMRKRVMEEARPNPNPKPDPDPNPDPSPDPNLNPNPNPNPNLGRT